MEPNKERKVKVQVVELDKEDGWVIIPGAILTGIFKGSRDTDVISTKCGFFLGLEFSCEDMCDLYLVADGIEEQCRSIDYEWVEDNDEFTRTLRRVYVTKAVFEEMPMKGPKYGTTGYFIADVIE